MPGRRPRWERRRTLVADQPRTTVWPFGKTALSLGVPAGLPVHPTNRVPISTHG